MGFGVEMHGLFETMSFFKHIFVSLHVLSPVATHGHFN